MNMHFKHLAASITILGAFQGPVHAESPMVTDDAGTLDAGRAKLEAGVLKSGPTRGMGLNFAYAPADNLELGLTHAHMRDASISPGTRSNIDGLAAKWIALRQGPLRVGMKLEMARTGDTLATPSVRSTLVTGLVSYLWESGYVLHANLGRGWERSNATVASTRWAIGAELPIAAKLQLTGDLFGASGDAPGKLLGLRWSLTQGVKLSVAMGRSNNKTMASTGAAWEF